MRSAPSFFQPALGLLALAIVGLWPARALAAGAVKWSSALAGPARGDLEKALAQPFEEPYETRNLKTKEEKTVGSCQ